MKMLAINIPLVIFIFVIGLLIVNLSHKGSNKIFRTWSLLLISVSWIMAVNLRYEIFGSDIWGEIGVIKYTLSNYRWNTTASHFHSYFYYGGLIFTVVALERLSSLTTLTCIHIIQIIGFMETTIITLLATRSILRTMDNYTSLAVILPLLFSPLPALFVTKTVLSLVSPIIAMMLLAVIRLLNNERKVFVILFLATLSLPLIHIATAILLVLIFFISFLALTVFKIVASNRKNIAETIRYLRIIVVIVFMLFISTFLIHGYITFGFDHYLLITVYTLSTLFDEKEASRNPFPQHIMAPIQPSRLYLLAILYSLYIMSIFFCFLKPYTRKTSKSTNNIDARSPILLIKILNIVTLAISLLFFVIKRLGAGLYPDRVLMYNFILGGPIAFALLFESIRNRNVAKYLAFIISIITLIATFLWPANLLSGNSDIDAIKLRDLRYIDDSNKYIYTTAIFAYRFLGEPYLQKLSHTRYSCYHIDIYIDTYTSLPLSSLLSATNYLIHLSLKDSSDLVVISSISKFSKYYVYEGQLFDIANALAKYSIEYNVIYNSKYSFISVRK